MPVLLPSASIFLQACVNAAFLPFQTNFMPFLPLYTDKITLSAQCYIKELYKSVGFKEVSEQYEEAGIPHVKMKFEI